MSTLSPALAIPDSLLAREAGAGSILTGRSISAVFVPKGKFPKGKTQTPTKTPTGNTNVGP